MANVVHRPFTAHDYYSLPETGRRHQLIDGELIMSPSPSRFHQKIIFNLISLLGIFVREARCGEIYFAPFDVELSAVNVFQPDIVYFSNSRKSLLTDHGAEGAPDLVIEVLSPSTRKYDAGTKRDVYARTGVTELWLVDPDARTVQVFRLQEDPATPVKTYTESGGGTLTTPLLPGLEISVAAVFEDH